MRARKKTRRRKQWVIRSPFVGKLVRAARSPFGKVLLAIFIIAGVAGLAVFNHYYWEYAKIIDAKLSGGPFDRTSKVVAAPDPVFVGDELTLEEALSRLRGAGYSESRHNRLGHFRVREEAVEIYPGSLSYFAQEPAVIYFDEGQVSRIVSLNDSLAQTVYELEPAVVTHVFDQERSKRRLLKYPSIPAHVRNAILAIEDHRFFDHHGLDIVRTTRAAIDGLVEWRRPRGTSTVTQQLARQFFLTPEQTYRRKLAELLIAFQLESRLSKEEIFEFYVNQIPLGRRGSFNIMGMGEASQAYFDKDIRELSLAEAALLAGLIQRPSYLNPFRHPERAKSRRNVVLQAMLRHGFISADEYREAAEQPIDLAVGEIEYSNAPYFVDLVHRRLQDHFGEEELITQAYTIFTTLDLQLQKAAVEAVRKGMAAVDEIVARQHSRGRYTSFGYPRDGDPPQAQAALVALDPATGEVKAIVGGRNYGLSQLNRVLAHRQPGSSFKPFVYAAAIDTALDSERQLFASESFESRPGQAGEVPYPITGEVLTPISTVDDVPTTFWWDDEPYEPSNFSNKIHGITTLRNAMRNSMNIATVKVAQRVGYERVADLARRAGLGAEIKATPAIALGAYEVTPLDIAAAYTIFPNNGMRMEPHFVRSVRDTKGRTILRNRPQEEEVLDPRVAYVVTHMLEDVLRAGGTGIGVRVRGFTEPAAGKTGTDDDGWFAGFTSKLVCVVWVGFDDNTDLKIQGAHSALPIWTEFMKRAHSLREYRNPEPFEPVEGVLSVVIDSDTHQLATHACPNRSTEVFIAGSEPIGYCDLHGGRRLLATNVAGWDSETPPENQEGEEAAPKVIDVGELGLPSSTPGSDNNPDDSEENKQKQKKGLFGRILDVFR